MRDVVQENVAHELYELEREIQERMFRWAPAGDARGPYLLACEDALKIIREHRASWAMAHTFDGYGRSAGDGTTELRGDYDEKK